MWDAEEGLRPKREMPMLDLDDLKQGDVCLIECKVNRFPPPEPGESAAEARKRPVAEWPRWIAAFELQNITRLWNAHNVPKLVESDEEYTEREDTPDDAYEL